MPKLKSQQLPTKESRQKQQNPKQGSWSQLQILKKAFYTFAQEVTCQIQSFQKERGSNQLIRDKIYDLQNRLKLIETKQPLLQQQISVKRMASLIEKQSLCNKSLSQSIQDLKNSFSQLQNKTMKSLWKQVYSLKNQFNEVIQENSRSITNSLQPFLAQIQQTNSKSKRIQSLIQQTLNSTRNVKVQTESLKVLVEKNVILLKQNQKQTYSQLQQQRSDMQQIKFKVQEIESQGREKESKGLKESLRQMRKIVNDFLVMDKERHEQWDQQLSEIRTNLEKNKSKQEKQQKRSSQTVKQMQNLQKTYHEELRQVAKALKLRQNKHKDQLEKLVHYIIESEKSIRIKMQQDQQESNQILRKVELRIEKHQSILALYRDLIAKNQSQKQVSSHFFRQRSLSPYSHS